MDDQIITQLEQKFAGLYRLCDELTQENRLLKEKGHALEQEIDRQKQRNSLAAAKIESMITRLKTLDMIQ